MNAKLVCAVMALVVCVNAGAFTPPAISNNFIADITVTEWPGPEVDEIVVWSDAVNQRFLSLTNETVDGLTLPVYDLDFYNRPAGQPNEYVYAVPLSQCTVSNTQNTQFPSLFSWVSESTYEGQTMVYDQLVDVWTLNRNNGQFIMSLYTTGSGADVVPVRLSEFIYDQNSTSLTLVLDFNSFSAVQPSAEVFTVPSYCGKQLTAAADAVLPLVRSTAATKAIAVMSGNLGIHWECDLCKAAAETLISVGCGGGSALCGPFAEVCEAMCEDGCMVASCSDWACKKFGFC